MGPLPLLLAPIRHLRGREIRNVGLLGKAVAALAIARQPAEHRGLGGQRVGAGRGRGLSLPGRRRRGAEGKEARGRLAAAAADDGEELVPFLGDGAGRGRALAEPFGLAVEPGEHGHCEAVVVAVALGDQLAVAVEPLDAAVHPAREQFVAHPAAGDEDRRAPGQGEGAAFRALAQIVGGVAADPDGAAGVGDDPAGGEGVEELRLPLGREAVRADRPPHGVEFDRDVAIGEAGGGEAHVPAGADEMAAVAVQHCGRGMAAGPRHPPGDAKAVGEAFPPAVFLRRTGEARVGGGGETGVGRGLVIIVRGGSGRGLVDGRGGLIGRRLGGERVLVMFHP